jgi:molybdenum cofactor biosynthesis enzyme MoaA
MVASGFPSRLFVEVTTRCNLLCEMCVKQDGSGRIAEGDLPPQTFAALAPAFPHLESLVLNGIGEPLLHPRLEEFVARARALLPERATIGFQSNGMLLTEPRARALLDAGLDRICLSLDAVSRDGFRALRCGGELQGVAPAFANLTRAQGGRAGRDLKIGIEFVLLRGNIAELPAAIRWAGAAGASFAIVTQLRRRKASQAVGRRLAAGARHRRHLERSRVPVLQGTRARLPLPVLLRLRLRALRLRRGGGLRTGLLSRAGALRGLPLVHRALPLPDLSALRNGGSDSRRQSRFHQE